MHKYRKIKLVFFLDSRLQVLSQYLIILFQTEMPQETSTNDEVTQPFLAGDFFFRRVLVGSKLNSLYFHIIGDKLINPSP